MEHQVDTCYCPAGQAHRLSQTEGYIYAFFMVIGVGILAKIIAMVQDAVKAVRMATTQMVRLTDWEVVGWSIVGVLVSLIIVSLLFVRFYSHRSEPDTKPMAWSRKLRTWLMTRNLIRQFKLHPELRRKTVDEILDEMEAGHEPSERVTDGEMIADYSRAYARALDKIRRTNPELAQHLRTWDMGKGVGATGPNHNPDSPIWPDYPLKKTNSQ